MSDQGESVPTPKDVAEGAENPSSKNEDSFTPPASQEELDRLIGSRLAKERSKFSDYEDLKAKAAEFDKAQEAAKSEQEKQAEQLEKLQRENQDLKQREQVAQWKKQVSEETGVPASVLAGDSLEDLQSHAEALKPLIENSINGGGLRPIPNEGTRTGTALNGDGLEQSLRNALGIY